MAIVEQQQQEIQSLRHAIALGFALDDVPGSAFNSPSKARPLTPLSSPGSELLTPRYKDALVDADRYKALCEKMQRVRSKLVKRDVQVRRARAQILAVQDESKRYQESNVQLQTRVQQLCMDLQRETALKDEAIEKAAQSLTQCDRLEDSLMALKAQEKAMRLELHAQQERSLQAESSVHKLQEDKTQLELQVTVLTGDRDDMQRELLLLQSTAHSEQVQMADYEQLVQQNVELQDKVSTLDRIIALQTEQMQKQQQSLTALEAERVRRDIESHRERDDSKRHVVHLLQANIKLQQQVDNMSKRDLCMEQRVQELQENRVMVAEELELMRLKDKHRQQQLRKYDDDYTLLLSSYRELVKASSNMELSRRDLMAALTQSKKKVSVLQSALEALDVEIQNLSKAVASNRNRCANHASNSNWVELTSCVIVNTLWGERCASMESATERWKTWSARQRSR